MSLREGWGDGSGVDQIALTAGQMPVSLALVVDVSGSISDADYRIQKEGTGLAINNVADYIVQMAKDGTPVIASYIEFSGYAKVRIEPRVLQTLEDVEDFAQEIEVMERMPDYARSGTTTSLAIERANKVHMQVERDFGTLSRKVTDISADGYEYSTRGTLLIENDEIQALLTRIHNEGWQREVDALEDQKRVAENLGIEINGIVMRDLEGHADFQETQEYYREHVVRGRVFTANSAEEYGKTLEQKLRLELAGPINLKPSESLDEGTPVLPRQI